MVSRSNIFQVFIWKRKEDDIMEHGTKLLIWNGYGDMLKVWPKK